MASANAILRKLTPLQILKANPRYKIVGYIALKRNKEPIATKNKNGLKTVKIYPTRGIAKGIETKFNKK